MNAHERRERMPPLPPASLNDEQRKVVADLTNGPRGGVKGPFIALLRSPKLLERLGSVGEYLRFESTLPGRVREFVMLVVAREWTNQFEWAVHVPLALKNGVQQAVIDALAQGSRPHAMAEEEEIAYEICSELSRTHGLCDATYERALERFGESGLLDIATIYGYFVTVCAIMNIAHTPPPPDSAVPHIACYPA